MLFELARDLFNRIRQNAFLIGFLSLVWLLFRTGSKPTRMVYPCQRAAAANSIFWLTAYIVPILLAVRRKISTGSNKKKMSLIVLMVVVAVSLVLFRFYGIMKPPQGEVVRLDLRESIATSQPSSSVFVVNGTRGDDTGINVLINLMGEHGLLFYKSLTPGRSKGPDGLIAKDDVIIIKVNSQWNERGGTNTDLLKALIRAILDHPDDFTGEIIVADNGQAQAGSAGNGGSFDWTRNNAENISQSVQNIVNLFAPSHKVSSYLWDRITTTKVAEYYEGDNADGYIINASANPRTGLMVSYPKFKTKYGTYVSFKLGVWDPQKRIYEHERLKVINIPVLKSHSTYGVTASVKHYMGVVSDKLTAGGSHQSVGAGGMGTEISETRFPVLNILDAIWVNAVPGAGPSTPYATATRLNLIAASTDPVALDYWASKYILLEVAGIKGYTNVASMNPESRSPGTFGYWLWLSMQEMVKAGYLVTMDESRINVYLANL